MHLFCFCKVQGVVHILKLNAYLYTNTFVYCYSLSLWILSGFCNMLNAIEFNALFYSILLGKFSLWSALITVILSQSVIMHTLWLLVWSGMCLLHFTPTITSSPEILTKVDIMQHCSSSSIITTFEGSSNWWDSSKFDHDGDSHLCCQLCLDGSHSWVPGCSYGTGASQSNCSSGCSKCSCLWSISHPSCGCFSFCNVDCSGRIKSWSYKDFLKSMRSKHTCFSLLVMECLREELLLSWTPWTKLSSQLHCLLFWRFCSSLDIGNSFTMSAWKKSSWKLKSLKAARINNWRIFIKPLQLNYQSSEQRIPPLIQNCMFLESYNFGAKSTVRFWMVYYACNLEPCILLSNVWQSSGEPGAVYQWGVS